MAGKSPIPEHIQNYINAVTEKPTAIQQELRERTAVMAEGMMQVTHDQAALLSTLVKLCNAQMVLEIGVFTGYSSLAMAMALPPSGRIIACDVSEEWTSVAREYWERAGVAGKIDLRLKAATETVRELIDEGMEGLFDLAFIDADKGNYEEYYEASLQLVRPNGLVLVDNIFWSGEAAEETPQGDTAALLRALALKIGADPRVDSNLLAVGDGLIMARRR